MNRRSMPARGASAVSPATDLAVRLYSRAARVLATVLVAASASSVPALVALLVWASGPPLLPPALFRLVALWTVAPAVGAWAVHRGARARARVEDDMLVLDRHGLRVEVPCSAITRLAPWRLPVPEPALGIELRSGRRLAWSVALDDPVRLLERLRPTSASTVAAASASTPAVRYAGARAARWHRSVAAWLVKFPVFALGPGTAFFVTHQWIAYGGPRGQYYLEGALPYAMTFAVHWLTMTIYLALWAGLWRGAAETLALAGAWAAPGRAAALRAAAEWTCRAVYFVGVPVAVVLRYLA
jgi:apolipoprotein N-acyltransferase